MRTRLLAPLRWVLLCSLALLVQASAQAALPQLELQVELDPDTRRFEAQALVVTGRRQFDFELHEALTVRAASVDGRRLEVVAAGRDGAVRRWRVALPPGAVRLRLEYGGTLSLLDRSLDQRGVLRGLPPMAAPEGSFLPAGGAWYPQPALHFTYRVSVSLPAGQRALVAGRLVSEQLPENDAGRYRASFEFLQPADGIDLMAGPWLVREQSMPRAGGEPVRLRTYFTPELDGIAGLADAYLDDTRRYLELYSAQIGAYPFSEFSVVASPLPTGFGMPTLTYIGADVLKLPFIRATSLGHEVLHNWWGNGVYVDYASGNWSEGLTTFMADYAYKERESDEAARQMRLGWLRDFAALPAGSLQPLTAFRSRTHGAAAALGYGKSAMLFVMLRDTIGSDPFNRGLRTFWDRHRFKVASWGDLQHAFEQASGKPLDSFFAQWLHRTDAPAVKIVSASSSSSSSSSSRSSAGATSQEGKTGLKLVLEQGAPPYALRLPLQLVYADRSEMRWTDIRRAQEEVALTVDTLPDGVQLDPDLRLWRRLEPAQLPPILRQWSVAASPRLLIASSSPDVQQAVQALARRLFEVVPQMIAPDQPIDGGEPVLLAGLHADVDVALAKAGLPPRPATLATVEGAVSTVSAQVWTIERPVSSPVAVVSAADAGALRALLRPLPHYGAKSWLLFNGSRMLSSGVWPVPAPQIPVQPRARAVPRQP